MLDNIESIIKDLLSVLQMARLYSTVHHEFMKSLDKAYVTFSAAFEGKKELVIGLIGAELAFEKEILFELDKTAGPLISILKNLGIEKMTFYPQLEKEELRLFISFLITPKEEIKAQPQEYLQGLGVTHITVGKITVSGVPAEGKKATGTDLTGLYAGSAESVGSAIDKALDGKQIDYLSLRLALGDIMQSLGSSYQDLLQLVTVKRYDTKVAVHLLDVSILSMYFAHTLGLDKEDILDIGIAALFHDVGKLYVSRKILNKAAKLTEEEFSQIKSHVRTGAEILLNYVDTLGILPAIVAFEHHLRYDLKGYPQLAFPYKPSLPSLIVTICDVYDACFQRRSYKGTYPPNMVYEIMIKEKARLFDPELLEKFFMVMGVWPVGTIVYLSDQRIAVVRRENTDDVFSPEIETVFPVDKREFIDLRKQKGSLKIEYSLNPTEEGKGYLDLV
ncbi:MAG: HD domain-containing protein [Candidatus Omnitrophota bacterium]|jgi:putative nucleotidyltransferase with HDIG domain|nr:MAG: HD domain-containing protein [Candidatus Omnitrophota bacterium]